MASEFFNIIKLDMCIKMIQVCIKQKFVSSLIIVCALGLQAIAGPLKCLPGILHAIIMHFCS